MTINTSKWTYKSQNLSTRHAEQKMTNNCFTKDDLKKCNTGCKPGSIKGRRIFVLKI